MFEGLICKPHDLARTQIERWRGSCLNTFSRGERTIINFLEHTRSPIKAFPLKGMAAQRLEGLCASVGSMELTDKQRNTVQAALDQWLAMQPKRVFFAYGVIIELIDRHGQWHVKFEATVVRKGHCTNECWCVREVEARAFETDLHRAFSNLKGRLCSIDKWQAAAADIVA